MGARLMAISRRLVAIWLQTIWLYGPGTREYLIYWPLGARLVAISRRLVAIWLLAIWLYGLRVWWPKLLAMWLT